MTTVFSNTVGTAKSFASGRNNIRLRSLSTGMSPRARHLFATLTCTQFVVRDETEEKHTFWVLSTLEHNNPPRGDTHRMALFSWRVLYRSKIARERDLRWPTMDAGTRAESRP